jgi:ribosome-binding factor A
MHPRIARVNSLLQEALAGILKKYYREESVTITITRIATSSDLHYTTVYVSIIGNEAEQKRSLRWLHKKKFELRNHINREIVLKFSPELHFLIDNSHLRAIRIGSLLSEVETELPLELPDATHTIIS